METIFDSYEFRKKCYELYKLDWMMSHNHGLSELFEELRNIVVNMAIYGDLDSDANAACNQIYNEFIERGFDGEIYACYDEFLHTEYIDSDYMSWQLDKEEYDFWLSDIKEKINEAD